MLFFRPANLNADASGSTGGWDHDHHGPAGLTGRQVEVLGLLAEALTDAEIADRLSLSAKTVGHHVSALLAKLGVGSRRQAAAAAASGSSRRKVGSPAARGRERSRFLRPRGVLVLP